MIQLPPEDLGIISLCSHGQSLALDQSGFSPDWLTTSLAQRLVASAISLARDGKPVNILSILSRCRGLQPGEINQAIEIFKNGLGPVDFDSAKERAYNIYLHRQVSQVSQELSGLLASRKDEVLAWLPDVTTELVQAIREGVTYDPRPSSHAKKELPQVAFVSLILGMNDILRGGYRNGELVVYAGLTKHGKTTTLNTHVVDSLLHRKKVVLIKTENTEQSATAEIILALTGLSPDEIITKIFLGNETETGEARQERYQTCLEYLDDYLRIYDWRWLNDERLKRIARWDRPQVIAIDYLKQQSAGFFARRTNSKDEVGDLADWLLTFAKEEGISILTAGQVSDQAAKMLVKNDTAEPAILYGSARVGYASDLYALIKRHVVKRNTAYFRVWLDRFTGVLDTIHEIPLDTSRRILSIPRLTQGGFIL